MCEQLARTSKQRWIILPNENNPVLPHFLHYQTFVTSTLYLVLSYYLVFTLFSSLLRSKFALTRFSERNLVHSACFYLGIPDSPMKVRRSRKCKALSVSTVDRGRQFYCESNRTKHIMKLRIITNEKK